MLGTIAAYNNFANNSDFSMIEIGMYVLMVIGYWMVFRKANMEGWYALIPYYNYYKMYQATAGSGCLFVLCFIPVVGDVLLGYYTAKAFGKSQAFMICLMLLPCVFYPILGFDDSCYYGPLGMYDNRSAEDRDAQSVEFEVHRNTTEQTKTDYTKTSQSGAGYQQTYRAQPEPDAVVVEPWNDEDESKVEDVEFTVEKSDKKA